jgi:hypothetical protein
MVIVGQQVQSLNTARRNFSRLQVHKLQDLLLVVYYILQLLQEQQKNIMELLGQVPNNLNTAREI